MVLLFKHYDAIVIGLGGVGSFALRALAKETSHISRQYLGVELASLAYLNHTHTISSSSNGIPSNNNDEAGYSSRGLSRIYRRAYFEHENYVPWIDYSIQVFQDMEQSSGISLMKECGMIIIEEENIASKKLINNPNNKIYRHHREHQPSLPPLISSSLHSAKVHNIPIQLIHSEQLQHTFPQFYYGTNNSMMGLLEPGGGLLRPERIMKVALRDAMSYSNISIHDNTKVISINDMEQHGIVELELFDTTTNQKIKVTTNKLLVSMGAWTGTVIPSLNPFLNPIRQVQGWIDTKHTHTQKSSAFDTHRTMPAFVYISPHWPEALYGVPCDEDADDGVDNQNGALVDRKDWLKVGIHKQDTLLSEKFSYDNHRLDASATELLELQRVVPLCIDKSTWCRPGQSHEQVNIVQTKPCVYTMTPDKHFMIGEVSKNIFCVAGLSGHGFKMTPSLGQMMADFAFGKNVSNDWNTDFCSLQRFG